MSGLGIPLLALASGWGFSRLVPGAQGLPTRLVRAVVLSMIVTGGWMALLDLVGVPWTLETLAAGWLPGLLLAAVPRLPRGSPAVPSLAGWSSPWSLLATAGVATRAFAVAAVPAFGWDFRYIWGLKARVFAAAGAHDLGWLLQPVHTFAHPAYPPLWPDLLAAGIVGGAPAGSIAAGWGAVLAIGLGAACWRLARPAGQPQAALAALAGAWFPTLLAPGISYSGSAEPLAALLFAAALLEIEMTAEGAGSWTLLAAALAGLALTKNEGSVLALLFLACFLHRLDWRRRSWVFVAAFTPFALWQLTVTAAGIPRLETALDPARALSRAVALPGAALSVMTPVLFLEILGAVLVLTAPRSDGSRPLKLLLALWLTALGAAYLVSPHDLHWHLGTSLQRVLAIPLPGLLALLLGSVPRTKALPAPDGH